jgi:hypothetical protein
VTKEIGRREIRESRRQQLSPILNLLNAREAKKRKSLLTVRIGGVEMFIIEVNAPLNLNRTRNKD